MKSLLKCSAGVGDPFRLSIFIIIISCCSILVSSNVGLALNEIEDFLDQSSARIDNNDETKPTVNDQINEEVKVETITPAIINQEMDVPFQVINRCCARQRKLVNVGFDITGSSHYLDIGHCRHFCTSRPKHKVNRGRNTISNSSVLINAASEAVDHRFHERHSCTSNGQCVPSKLRSEKIHLLHGLIDVEIIEDCQCVNKPRICSRKSRKVAFFSDTPYETQVDVGSCRGPCQEGLECRPLRNRTVTIEGPNGAVCTSIIEECTCTQECYRMQYKGVFVDRIWNSTLNSTLEIVKELDIGRCIGECSTSVQEQCVLCGDSEELIALYWNFNDNSKHFLHICNQTNAIWCDANSRPHQSKLQVALMDDGPDGKKATKIGICS